MAVLTALNNTGTPTTSAILAATAGSNTGTTPTGSGTVTSASSSPSKITTSTTSSTSPTTPGNLGSTGIDAELIGSSGSGTTGPGGSSTVSAVATPNGVVTTTVNNQTGQTFTQTGSGPMVYQGVAPGYPGGPSLPATSAQTVSSPTLAPSLASGTQAVSPSVPPTSPTLAATVANLDYSSFGNNSTVSSSGGNFPTYVVTGTLPNGENYSITTGVPYIQNPEYQDQAVDQAYQTLNTNPSLANAIPNTGLNRTSAAVTANLNSGQVGYTGSPPIIFEPATNTTTSTSVNAPLLTVGGTPLEAPYASLQAQNGANSASSLPSGGIFSLGGTALQAPYSSLEAQELGSRRLAPASLEASSSPVSLSPISITQNLGTSFLTSQPELQQTIPKILQSIQTSSNLGYNLFSGSEIGSPSQNITSFSSDTLPAQSLAPRTTGLAQTNPSLSTVFSILPSIFSSDINNYLQGVQERARSTPLGIVPASTPGTSFQLTGREILNNLPYILTGYPGTTAYNAYANLPLPEKIALLATPEAIYAAPAIGLASTAVGAITNPGITALSNYISGQPTTLNQLIQSGIGGAIYGAALGPGYTLGLGTLPDLARLPVGIGTNLGLNNLISLVQSGQPASLLSDAISAAFALPVAASALAPRSVPVDPDNPATVPTIRVVSIADSDPENVKLFLTNEGPRPLELENIPAETLAELQNAKSVARVDIPTYSNALDQQLGKITIQTIYMPLDSVLGRIGEVVGAGINEAQTVPAYSMQGTPIRQNIANLLAGQQSLAETIQNALGKQTLQEIGVLNLPSTIGLFREFEAEQIPISGAEDPIDAFRVLLRTDRTQALANLEQFINGNPNADILGLIRELFPGREFLGGIYQAEMGRIPETSERTINIGNQNAVASGIARNIPIYNQGQIIPGTFAEGRGYSPYSGNPLYNFQVLQLEDALIRAGQNGETPTTPALAQTGLPESINRILLQAGLPARINAALPSLSSFPNIISPPEITPFPVSPAPSPGTTPTQSSGSETGGQGYVAIENPDGTISLQRTQEQVAPSSSQEQVQQAAEQEQVEREAARIGGITIPRSEEIVAETTIPQYRFSIPQVQVPSSTEIPSPIQATQTTRDTTTTPRRLAIPEIPAFAQVQPEVLITPQVEPQVEVTPETTTVPQTSPYPFPYPVPPTSRELPLIYPNSQSEELKKESYIEPPRSIARGQYNVEPLLNEFPELAELGITTPFANPLFGIGINPPVSYLTPQAQRLLRQTGGEIPAYA